MKSRIREFERSALSLLFAKNFGFVVIAVLAALLSSCSSDESNIEELQQPVNEQPQVYTMTIEANKGGDNADSRSTRALSLSGKTLNATWAEDEIVKVYQSGSEIGELTAAASETTSTTLTGTFASAPSTEAALTFYFHTAADPSYTGQDGTLETIASSYDFCEPATVTTGNFTVNETTKKITIPDGISFGANQQAIVKFTLKDHADVEFNATQLTVSDGNNTYTVTPASATSEFFVALPGFSNQMVTLTATDGTNNVTYEKDGVTFTNGQYYEIGVKMTYLISTLAQWNSFAAKVNGGQSAIRAKQTANISGVTTVVGNSESNPFKGSYNGQGYTISNVNISGTTNVGLFGCVNDASSVIENVVVASGKVYGSSQNVGAVVGQLNSGTVTHCANYAEVESGYKGNARLGGIVGWMRARNNTNLNYGGDDNHVEYCINYGYIHAQNYVGGIVGTFGAGTLTYCQNYGLIEVTGDYAAGGIAGWQYSSSYVPANNHNGGNITTSSSNSTSDTNRYIISNRNTNKSNYSSNSYLTSLTATIAGTAYTGDSLAQFAPVSIGPKALTSNPAGITISGTTYSYNTPAPAESQGQDK